MKIISHAKLTKGYEHWKQAFDENESLRQEYGVTVLAYGHPKENKDEIYTVLQVETPGIFATMKCGINVVFVLIL